MGALVGGVKGCGFDSKCNGQPVGVGLGEGLSLGVT